MLLVFLCRSAMDLLVVMMNERVLLSALSATQASVLHINNHNIKRPGCLKLYK
jgi:hypothetical protein